MRENLGFSFSESGVGGMVLVEPMAREPLGGEVGRKDRVCDDGEFEWTY